MRTRSLASAAAAGRYQREWFAGLRERVAAGEPLALVNADVPQEIFRAMDIPYVVSQWWASLVAAKQRSAHYLELVRERGYPDYTEQYNSLTLGAAFDPEPENGPWGGLPAPSLVVADATGDVTRKIFDLWGERPGTTFYALESAAENEVPVNWWDLMPHRWEEAVGTARLDLLTAELENLIRFLETTTGRVFSETRFREVMALVNEQEEWNRRARDLIARTRPVPLDVSEGIPAVMVPQWHRGTEWGRDAARSFYEEVRDRVAAGEAACPGERARLMWIGRGLWYDMDFYQRFQDEYGAVFVWSMYLAVAADGYLRYGGDPLRALAARFAAFGDQLYTPPWSAEWYVKEARLHGVDGVVHLVSDDPRGSYFTTRALETAGIPVIEIEADNVDARGYDPDSVATSIGTWLTETVLPRTR
ncbi:2-hydroxyacyl-CoA dehydratase [Actinomadura craniellae]|uniref:2-hydroxyacyl-CoA dehydratase n=1 Tax=Actinomadura craniellae TaxID=2231787 RepID=A0A365HA18_9ACTN|nr:2-hydroxyacyl-CoA dehydratase family protein [Actinomadura craniellae]RAY15869.1 2-hydroxyacyl-CoA dehydratase [Actinomadura craniellae]